MPSGVHLTSSVTPDVMRIGVPPIVPDDDPGYYALVHLGGSDFAIEQYDPSGAYIQRVAATTIAAMTAHDSDDSALLLPNDAGALVGDEAAFVSGMKGVNGAVWSWDWRNGALYEYEDLQTHAGTYFRPQLAWRLGSLWWTYLGSSGSDERAQVRKMDGALGNRVDNFIGGGDFPFAQGYGWVTGSRYYYRLTWDETGSPVTRIARTTATGSPIMSFQADPGWALVQGCPDPAGGDVGLGGRSDLAGKALNRATALTTIAAAWTDDVPVTAARPLATTVDTAGDVCVPYLLASGDVQLFHGDPTGSAAEVVRTLAPEAGATFLAVSARP